MAKKNENSKKDARENVTTPMAVFETLTAGALISAGKFAYDASKDAYVALKPDKPLQVTVEDSDTQDSKHRVTAVVANLGLHAVYLESVYVADPKGVDVDVIRIEDPKIGWDVAELGQGPTAEAPTVPFPVRLMSERSVRLGLRIDTLPVKRLKSKPFAILACNYTVLGIAAKPKRHEFGVAIR